jgi:hypothetical protein
MNREALAEQAYLVERGVRALALVGCCPVNEATHLAAELALAGQLSPGAVPFVVSQQDGRADYGYGASRWAIDLFVWASSDAVPLIQRERILGLLFGYAPEAVERFESRMPVMPGCNG